jgi:hypothetical protein
MFVVGLNPLLIVPSASCLRTPAFFKGLSFANLPTMVLRYSELDHHSIYHVEFTRKT